MDSLTLTLASLADPTRRAIVHRLTRGPATVHEINRPFNLSQQMISKHVATLVRARVITKYKRGRESVCTLRPASIRNVARWAFDFERFWNEKFDNLDTLLERLQAESATPTTSTAAPPKEPRHVHRRSR